MGGWPQKVVWLTSCLSTLLTGNTNIHSLQCWNTVVTQTNWFHSYTNSINSVARLQGPSFHTGSRPIAQVASPSESEQQHWVAFLLWRKIKCRGFNEKSRKPITTSGKRSKYRIHAREWKVYAQDKNRWNRKWWRQWCEMVEENEIGLKFFLPFLLR